VVRDVPTVKVIRWSKDLLSKARTSRPAGLSCEWGCSIIKHQKPASERQACGSTRWGGKSHRTKHACANGEWSRSALSLKSQALHWFAGKRRPVLLLEENSQRLDFRGSGKFTNALSQPEVGIWRASPWRHSTTRQNFAKSALPLQVICRRSAGEG